MPGGADPVATLDFSNGGSIDAAETVKLTDGYVYKFYIYGITLTGEFYMNVTVAGYADIIFSELCEFVPSTDLSERSIVQIIAYNNDDTHGYVSSGYPGCGFFEVSELNKNAFGTNKVEYNYSYGRKKILNAENFIKTRMTFLNLSMYQRNLLQTLCNCENLNIGGVAYYLVSDFTEVNKNEENEIFDLSAEFVTVADPTFFAVGSTEMPSSLKSTNFFNR
jgi:hypothetical protein